MNEILRFASQVLPPECHQYPNKYAPPRKSWGRPGQSSSSNRLVISFQNGVKVTFGDGLGVFSGFELVGCLILGEVKRLLDFRLASG
jgi:hypothetical protein